MDSQSFTSGVFCSKLRHSKLVRLVPHLKVVPWPVTNSLCCFLDRPLCHGPDQGQSFQVDDPRKTIGALKQQLFAEALEAEFMASWRNWAFCWASFVVRFQETWSKWSNLVRIFFHVSELFQIHGWEVLMQNLVDNCVDNCTLYVLWKKMTFLMRMSTTKGPEIRPVHRQWTCSWGAVMFWFHQKLWTKESRHGENCLKRNLQNSTESRYVKKCEWILEVHCPHHKCSEIRRMTINCWRTPNLLTSAI